MRKVIAGWHRILHNISYIHKIMISYLVFIALSIVMQSFLCFYMYHQIKNEIIISNTFKMEDTKKNFDSIFSNIEFIYQSLAQNPDLNELKSMLPRGTDYYLKINDFLKNPMLRQGINERNYNYYLYIKNGDMIISKNAAADRIDFYEQSIDTKRMSLGEWSAYFNGTGRRFARIPMIDNGAATQMMLSFLYPIPYSRVTEADITLVVTVDEGVFIDSYNRMGLNGYSSFSIVDHNGEMVMSTAEPEKEFLSVSGGMSFSGDSVIFNARSDIGNYNYIIEIENTVFWERLWQSVSLPI